AAPTVDFVLGQKYMVSAETAGGNSIAKHYDTFRSRGIIRGQDGKACPGSKRIGRAHVKGHDCIGGLTRNRRAIHTVACESIAARSIIDHWNRNKGCIGINSVVEEQALHS